MPSIAQKAKALGGKGFVLSYVDKPEDFYWREQLRQLRTRLNLLSLLLRIHPRSNGGIKKEEKSDTGMPQKNKINITKYGKPAASGPVRPETEM